MPARWTPSRIALLYQAFEHPLPRSKRQKMSSYYLVLSQRNTLNPGRFEEKQMKRIFLLILMVSSVALASETGSQQSVPTRSETATAGHSANDVVKVLAKRLALTEEQKSKILPIIVERRRKIQEVWNSSELFVRQKQVQERGINKESDRRINALLTGEQQKAYFAFEQEWRVERRLRQVSQPATN
jgi:periplasmic protein CpxP/Spy